MFFHKRYKRAVEVMNVRNKEYLNKVNAGNPDWDEETGTFKDEKKPAESADEPGKENPETGTDIKKDESRPATETASGEVSDKETQHEEGSGHSKKHKKHKKHSKFKEKGEKYENVMEKGDVKAIIIAAFMSFWPIFLVLIVILVVAWLLLKYAV